MASNNSSNKLLNQNAREAMDKFKMESASEVGVTLNDSYNGDLTSRQAGSIGGQMVKKMTTMRTVRFDRPSRVCAGHVWEVTYLARLTV